MTPELIEQARATVNAGHDLVQALRVALPPEGRDKLNLLSSAGAAIAVTLRWIDGRAELRVGVTMDDSPPETILSLDFGDVTPSQ